MSLLSFSTSLNHGQMKNDCGLRKPTEIGRFSLDSQRHFHHDRSQMMCIADHMRMGRVRGRVDLNDGFEDRYIKRDEEVKSRLDNLLRWTLANKNRLRLPGLTTQKHVENIIGDYPDFLVWRGHLTKMMCTPFENRDGWKMACQKLHNTIYISEVETDKAVEQRRNRSDRENRMIFWGRRFESYMVGPFPPPGRKMPIVDQKSVVVNDHQGFISVMRSRLNQHHSLIYGAEVDCCQAVEVLRAPDCYIELKTSRVFTAPRQEENFYRFKALKWWAQSYLCGIPQIICGFRDDNGFVTSIERFSTLELPNDALPLRNSWNPGTCLNFLDVVLSDIKKFYQQSKSLEDSVVFLTWSPGDSKVAYQVSKHPEDKFLPDWYLDEMSSLMT